MLQESLHPDALCYEIEPVKNPLWLRETLLGYHPTNGNPAMNPHVKKCSIKHVPAHIVKVNVNALRKVPISAKKETKNCYLIISGEI